MTQDIHTSPWPPCVRVRVYICIGTPGTHIYMHSIYQKSSPIITPTILLLLNRRVRLGDRRLGIAISLLHGAGPDTAIVAGLWCRRRLVRRPETVPEILLLRFHLGAACGGRLGGLLVLTFDEPVELIGGSLGPGLDALSCREGCVACLCGKVGRCDLEQHTAGGLWSVLSSSSSHRHCHGFRPSPKKQDRKRGIRAVVLRFSPSAGYTSHSPPWPVC